MEFKTRSVQGFVLPMKLFYFNESIRKGRKQMKRGYQLLELEGVSGYHQRVHCEEWVNGEKNFH